MKFKHPGWNKKWPHCITVHFDDTCFAVTDGVAAGNEERKVAILKHFGFKRMYEKKKEDEKNEQGRQNNGGNT